MLSATIIVAGLLVFWVNRNGGKVEAAWFDDSWGYRQIITLTNNGSTQTDYQVQVVVGTGDLIAAGKMQSDCNDLRFTDLSGKVLSYWTEYCRSGAGKNSSVWVTIPTLTTTPAPIYMYYGNPSAATASTFRSLPTGINLGDGADGAATVSGTVNFNSTTISGRTEADGVNPASTVLTALGSTTITATAAAGLSVGDEVLIINLQGTTSDYGNVGKYETARVTAINGAVLTLNHPLVNAYDGTTQKIMVQRVPNYSSVTVCTGSADPVAGCASAGTLNPASWSSGNGTGGVVMLRATGTVNVAASGSISGAGLGYAGGAGGPAGAKGGYGGDSYDGDNPRGGCADSSCTAGVGGGKSGSATGASPNSGGTRGGGGGGGSDGATNGTGGGAAGGGGGYGGGGGGGGANGDGYVALPSTANGGTGGSGGSTGTSAGGGGGGCRDNDGDNTAGANGGNAGSAGSNGSASCSGTAGTGGEVGSGATSGSGGGGAGGGLGSGGGGGGGGTYGTAALTTIFLGSGGGGGGGTTAGVDFAGAAGAAGGGIVYISAGTVTVAGAASANGADGTTPDAQTGSGGAGAGGSVFISGATVTLGSSLVSATGGAAGAADQAIAGSGGGGVGRIAVNYSTSTGSTNPSAGSTSTLPVAGSPSTEEKGNGPVAFWHLDDGQGTVAQDSTTNGNAGTLSGTTLPSWQTEDLCVSGKCLYFNGITSNVTAGTVNAVQTVSFWVRPASVSASLVQLASGVDVKAASGVVGTDGFTAPTIYVNGAKVTGSSATPFAASQWNFVTVTTGTGITANAITLGKMQTGVLNGFLDEVKLYHYARSAAQVKADYANSGINKGTGSVLGADPDQVNRTLSNGLVGYWKMDESGAGSCTGGANDSCDSSGNGNDGNWVNQAANTGGKFGNGVIFDGVNDTVDVAQSSSLNGVTDDITVSAWIKTTATGGGLTDNTFISKETAGCGSGYSDWFIHLLNGTVKFWTSGSECTAVASNATVNDGSWHLVTVTRKRSDGNHIIYIDGQYDTSKIGNTGSIGNAEDLYFGTINGTASDYTGSLDEVRIYNRVLSPAEVSILYQFAAGPVGYWKMEEGAGTTAADSSGNGYTTAAFTGNTAWTAGKFGKGLTFDGDGDYASITDASGVKIDLGATTDSYTVSGWAKTSTDGSGNATIVEKNDGSGAYPFSLYLNSSEHACFQISDGTNAPSACGSTALSDGAWHYLTGVRDVGADKVYIYVDGVQINSATDSTTATAANGDDTSIGNGGTSYTTNDFTGQIDEVRIYNYSRSPKQIIEDLNVGHPTGGSPIGTAHGYWKFDDGRGTTAYDSGASPNNGVLTSMNLVTSVGISGWNPNGKFNKALSFDGSNDNVDFGDLSYTEGASSLSWSFWVNPNSVAATKCLWCKYNNAATERSWAIESGTTNASAIRATLPTSTTEADGTTYGETPTGQLSVGVWTHVAVVYDGNASGNLNRLKIYINGVKQNLAFAGTIPATTQATTSTANAGESSDGARNFSGTLDEMKIYGGALTEAEVKLDYNRGSAISLGVLGTSTADGKTASSSAGSAYCLPGDTTTCNPPVAEWPYEEGQGTSVADTSGNNNTMTLSAASQWTHGVIGRGITFNGTSDTADYGDVNNKFDSVTKLTVTAWFKKPSVGGKVYIATKGSGANATRFELSALTDGLIYFVVRNGVLSTASTYSNDTNWHHVALVFDGTQTGNANRLKGFIDGTARALTFSNTVPSSTGNYGTAKLYSGYHEWFNLYSAGYVDQMRVFDYPLTAAQVANNYNRGLPASWWKFDECQGTVANDSIATISGTLNGGTPGDCNTASTAWANGKTGKFNYSLKFGTTPDLTTVTSTSTYPFSQVSSPPVSWGGWFYPTSSVNSQAFIDKKDQFRLYTDGSGNAICGVATAAGSYTDASSVTAPITLNTWNHVLCTYDGTTSLKTYVNGILKNTSTISVDMFLTTTTLYVGQLNDASNQFTGQADDIKIWAYSLTAYQVRMEFNQSSAVRFGPSSGAP